MIARRSLPAALVLLAAGCAHHGYFLEESTGRIYARNAFGRVTKRYAPGSDEYDAIALRFWPNLIEKPAQPQAAPGRRGRLAEFMRGLDKDQWHILLDLDQWTGDDRIDLAHLEDLEAMAGAVKGLPFTDYLSLKERTPSRSELKAMLLKGEREGTRLSPPARMTGR
ncbi:MAG: hypothetical protein HY554_16570 [Elusimicrobia bacterium]|nr:hypothetical protein [Elusimicrobiota bacterium]